HHSHYILFSIHTPTPSAISPLSLHDALPIYPVYVDTNVMAGHTGPINASGGYEGIIYLPCTAENGFVPEPPSAHADLIYLCFPNNPTGAVATRAQLERWVQYAEEHNALLLYDAAYEGYISDPEIPH